MAEKSHSQIGASSAERWFNCPGSVREVAKCPPQPESEYAKEGIAAHRLAEMCLRSGNGPHEHCGVPIWGIMVTPEMAEAVQLYLDVIDADLEKYHLMRKDLQIEHQFYLKEIHPDAYGTSDAVLPVFLTKCIVYDFKYGSGIAVDAEDNRQGLYYALGASMLGDYDEFEVVIVQPRAMHKLGPVRRWCVSKADLEVFAKQLKLAIYATQQANAPLHCGEWCKKTFCPALIQCPEAKKKMESAALMVFDADVEEIGSAPPAIENLLPETIKRILDMTPVIDAYLKAVEAYALDTVNKGGNIPGYKLVARRSNRKWKDESEVKAKFGKTAVRVVEEVLSPSQLETELKALMTLKEAKKEVESYTFKPDAGNVLVPLSDARDEVKPKLEQIFGNEDLLS